MKTIHENTTVIIFGTFHNGKKDSPAYIDRLGSILQEIMPNVICAELSPEQLNGKASCNSKPEYPEVILPFAKNSNVEVVPIQLGTEEGITLEKQMLRIIKESADDGGGRAMWEYSEYLDEVSTISWQKVLKNPAGIENVQLREFDLLVMEPEWLATSRYFPKLADQWEKWNQHFLDRIESTICDHAGKRILVTTGLAHKYWLWGKLESRDDIQLHNLQSYRRAAKH